MNKTLQQWQDYYAKEAGFEDFNDAVIQGNAGFFAPKINPIFIELNNKAAEAYARERCDAQK